tara:strand:+ start:724 stop:1482 length:759 start_codon:yes stop_codon:yes gene_type:complete
MNMKNLGLVSVALGIAVLVSGCASILSDNQYSVSLVSSPPGAAYTLKNGEGYVIQKGHTPDIVSLRSSAGYFKRAKYTLNMSKDGYADNETVLKGGIDGWYFGNLLLGGALGMLFVDPVTGSMWSLPEVQEVAMSASPEASTPTPAPASASTPSAPVAQAEDSYQQPVVAPVDNRPVQAARISSAPPVETTTRSVDEAIGYGEATRLASVHRCDSDIQLDYQVESGAMYRAYCEWGGVKKIMCQQSGCRVME